MLMNKKKNIKVSIVKIGHFHRGYNNIFFLQNMRVFFLIITNPTLLYR